MMINHEGDAPELGLDDAPRAKGPWFRVDAGTGAERCRSCQAVVYWITTAAGRPMPVDCAVAGGRAPTATEPGEGVSHFATCPQAKQWKGSSRRSVR